MKPEIIVDGVWLKALMNYGDVEWTTCWPGGTESITFSVEKHHRLFRPDAFVELDFGGTREQAGLMVEPTRDQPIVVEGLHRRGEDEPALDADGEMTLIPNVAVDVAISKGLPWRRTIDLGSTPVDLDAERPQSIARVLDARATALGQHWGVLADRRVWFEGMQATPTAHVLPGLDGLAISRDGYASTLTGRYLDSATSTYKTVTRTDLVAQARWGRVPHLIPEVLAQGAPMTAAAAAAYLDGLLAQGRSQIGWATPIEVQPGDLVNAFMEPIDIDGFHSRRTVRVHGLDLDVADLSGQSWIDLSPQRTLHRGGQVTIEPRGLSSPMNDALAAAASGSP